MTAVASVLTKGHWKLKEKLFLQKLPAYFHLSILTQHLTPAQGGTIIIHLVVDFGVQHQLMLICIGRHMDFVMTCVHLKVWISTEAFKDDNQ